MELIATQLPQEFERSPEDAVQLFLASYPVQKHLDLLTDVLTQSSNIDERLAALIHGAWDHVCRNHLWCQRFESLDDYQKSIDYSAVVKPILQRHKKSDRAKYLSSKIIQQQWNVHYTAAIPNDLRPSFWSKHLLTLLAALSKSKPLDEALEQLRESVKCRPRRGRSQYQLVPSDIKRVLCHRKRARLNKGSKKALMKQGIIDPGQPFLNPDTGELEQLITNEPQVWKNGCPSQDVNLNRSAPADIEFTDESSRTVTIMQQRNLQQADECSLEASFDKHPNSKSVASCGCAPICFPLIALLAQRTSEFSEPLISKLLHWARSVSWESFCREHLEGLYSQVFHSERVELDRRQVALQLERVYRSRCSSMSDASIQSHLTTSLPTITMVANSTQLLSRHTKISTLWSSWEETGLLHIPAFFTYMEEHGIFNRVRNALTRYASDDKYQLISQQCYELICQMIQQDPAYYAIVVACRPDKNWRLIHRPGHYYQDTHASRHGEIFHALRPSDAEYSATDGSTSNIQSTIMLPTFSPLHVVNFVPGSHQETAWQSEMRTPSSFSSPKCITMQPGDLILTMPNLLRCSQTFKSPALLNMSQSGVDDDFATLEDGGGTWTRLAIIQNYKEMGMQYLGAKERLDIPTHFQGCTRNESRLDSASALGEALMGRREWKDRKVIYQRNIVLGTDDDAALRFVNKVRDYLASEFHETLDLIEECHQGSAPRIAGREPELDISTASESYGSSNTAMVPFTDTDLLDLPWIQDVPDDMNADPELREAMEQVAEKLMPSILDPGKEMVFQTLDE